MNELIFFSHNLIICNEMNKKLCLASENDAIVFWRLCILFAYNLTIVVHLISLTTLIFVQG